MNSNVRACLILDTDTGQPLYSYFIDQELKKDPSVIPTKIRSGELKMMHEMGQHSVFTVLVTKESEEVTKLLKKFRERIERVYPDGMKMGEGNFADYVILQNIAIEVFVEGK